MSQWTHVAGIIRLDGAGPLMGMSKEDEIKNLSSRLIRSPFPFGSEGPVQFHFEHHGDDGPGHSSAYRGALMFWGDLRDFEEEDTEKIIQWLDWIVRQMGPFKIDRDFPWIVRQLVASIDVEFTKHKILVYFDPEKGLLKKIVSVSS